MTSGQRYRLPNDEELDIERWNRFVTRMKKLGVFEWDGRYDELVYDGMCWQLEIHAGDLHMKCGGCNGFPEVPEELAEKFSDKMNYWESVVKSVEGIAKRSSDLL